MENKEYFYLNGNAKIGPLTLDALKYAPISPSTMVWNNSLPDWVEARSLPELAAMFVSQPAPPPPVTNYNQGNTYHTGGNFNDPYMKPPMPENYLVWAIVSTVACCMPLGVVSIINATKVSSAYAVGDYTGSQKASSDAKKWAIWSAVAAGVFWILYIILFAVLGVAGFMSEF